MAKYVFDARKYPVGTLLSELGWFISDSGDDYEVASASLAENYWRSTTLAAGAIMTSKTLHTAYDIILVRRNESKRYRTAANQIVEYHGFRIHPVVTQVGGVITPTDYLESYTTESNGGVHVQGKVGALTIATEVAVVAPSKTREIAVRLQVNADGTYKLKGWYKAFYFPAKPFEEQETIIDEWNLEGLTGVAAGTPFAVTTPANFGAVNTDGACFTIISVGTDGDSAPYSDEALVITPPVVSISDVTGTTATASWS